MESLKKRPISEKSGDFGHFILSRKHRTEEPKKWKPYNIHTELMMGKEKQNITA